MKNILNCPVCGKPPKIIFDEAAYYTGWGAWYTIQCKPILRKTHLKIEEGKAKKEQCLEYAIDNWNKKVLKMKGGIGLYQTIRLKFDKEERTLTTFEYGRKIYNEQVKDIINLDYNIPIVFCFPKNIVKVSSSFVQGLFKDILDKIGYVGFEKRIIISSGSELLSKYIRTLIW